YFVIQVQPKDKFEREGTTIHYKLNLNFVQAAHGDTVHVPTVHGDVDMVNPEGTQTGKTFRLKVQGSTSVRGGAIGDQY
ncbi:DnaJ C-terminal domain-containing protein, partial [Streptococcus suis]